MEAKYIQKARWNNIKENVSFVVLHYTVCHCNISLNLVNVVHVHKEQNTSTMPRYS